MAKKKKASEQKKNDDKIVFAWLAAFLSIIGFVIALLVKPKNKYVMFYAKQSLVVFIFAVICSLISFIIGWVPFIGWLISLGLSLLTTIFWFFSWIYALTGKEKEVPVIGVFSKEFKF